MPPSPLHGARPHALALTGLLCACAARDPDLEVVFRDNQKALIECQVARASAEREADLARGQRELAERESEVAAERLARAQAQHKGSEQGEGHAGDRVLRALSDRDLITLAERLGHAATPLERGVLVAFGDLKSRLSFNPEHKVLSFVSHFSGYSSGWELVNAWNRDHRFGRVFIDAEGDLALETELDLEPGVRLEALVSWARSYGVLLTLFHGSLKTAEDARRGGRGQGKGRKGGRAEGRDGKQM
jgi:hypothetical protein